MWFIGVEVEQETSAPPPKKILDPPLVQHKNWEGKILRIWITIILHGGLGHEVQESLSHVRNEFFLVGLTAC